MQRLEIRVHRRAGREHRVVLGRLASAIVTVVLVVLAIAVVVLALLFDYLLVGVALAILWIAFVVAILRGAWIRLRR